MARFTCFSPFEIIFYTFSNQFELTKKRKRKTKRICLPVFVSRAREFLICSSPSVYRFGRTQIVLCSRTYKINFVWWLLSYATVAVRVCVCVTKRVYVWEAVGRARCNTHHNHIRLLLNSKQMRSMCMRVFKRMNSELFILGVFIHSIEAEILLALKLRQHQKFGKDLFIFWKVIYVENSFCRELLSLSHFKRVEWIAQTPPHRLCFSESETCLTRNDSYNLVHMVFSFQINETLTQISN